MLASLFLYANLGLITGVTLASFSVLLNYWYIFPVAVIYYRKKIKLIIIFIIFLSLGCWRYNTYHFKSVRASLSSYNGQQVDLLGVVNEEIEPGGNYQKVIVKVSEINNETVKALVLVYLEKYPELFYGDYIRLSGELKAPNNFSTFKYDRYLARYDIYSLMSWPQIKIINQSPNFYSKILDLKRKIYSILNSNLPEPEAGLASALLLGYKGTLDEIEKEAFSCCGLSHLVAISGSHLSLLAALCFEFLIYFGLSQRQSFKPVIIFLWFYTFLTGLQTSAIRSAIMATLSLWGKINGRQTAGGRLLFSAAAVMLFINPLLLRDDLGFQLSFLAMVALIYLCPVGQKIWGQGSIKNIIILTLAVQLLTWPITALNFGRFSLIAPLANLLVVWLFAFLLPALVIGVMLSYIIPGLSVLWLSPSYFMLRYIDLMGDRLATWPKACIDLEVSEPLIMGYYLLLGLFYLILVKKQQKPGLYQG